MYLDSLYQVYELISDVTPKTTFITCCHEEYRKLFSIISPETMVAMDEIPINTLDEILAHLGVRNILRETDRAIKRFGGKAFIRWDNHYPKDMCSLMHRKLSLEVLPKTMENACLFKSALEFIYLSLNSMRTLMFVKKEGDHTLYPIAVREPLNDLKYEFRVIIYKNKVKGALQYYYDEDYELSLEDAKELAREMMLFALDIQQRFRLSLPLHSV